MNSNKTENMKIKLSTLWVVAMFNYLYADVLGFYKPGMVEGIMAGEGYGFQYNQTFLLGAAILMEIPIVMVFLSRILKYEANRWANIITGIIMTVVILYTMTMTPWWAYYIFFGTVEVVVTALIFWFAWNWPKQ